MRTSRRRYFPATPLGLRERGAALLLALVLTAVLALLGIGLLTQALLMSRVAGTQRWSIKAFYAADAGINLARTRLRQRQTDAFSFALADSRAASASPRLQRFGTITVAVSELTQIGTAQPVLGSQTGGGQGGGTPLYQLTYRGTATAQQALTRSERVVRSTMAIGPLPLAPAADQGGAP